MNLLRRFLLFFLGLSVGSIFVMFFFQRKGTEFCYLPNCRVLKNLRAKPLVLTDSLQAQGYQKEQLLPLLTEGDVDFSRSDTHSTCRTYVITGEDTAHTSLEITIKSCEKEAVITSITPLK
ncbi:hypothetical protein [Capnocytophaga gingivalis]|uniref:hypothetical protein n=1 Tax=Capnocytophaga gingivalis TaxID=1017 RepID=UPI0028D83A5A|nr:hypothetical protein [Capnocytophaga gingivalis]